MVDSGAEEIDVVVCASLVDNVRKPDLGDPLGSTDWGDLLHLWRKYTCVFRTYVLPSGYVKIAIENDHL